ncbi:hypothetical protein [Flavobacterium sp.]|uniref:hypothetical protein n=1 Tax=Flavobacterium sp. TaxID=239 RepID=UPI0012261ED2|nr:hypothetical protein [Flavobacterium sp.]RZJ69646.1 MAG: hypothetical protein EOO49_16585 [Flavobacterium sp.]
MKKLGVALFFVVLFGCFSAKAQDLNTKRKEDVGKVFKFLSTGFSVMEKDEKGNWGKWSALKPSNIVISLDTKKGRIVVYSQEVQLYDIISYEQIQETENDIVYPFTCTDDDGMPFTVSLIERKKQGSRKQLYINQKNVVIVYNIENFPDKNIKVD